MLIRFNMQGAIPPPKTRADKDWLDDYMARCRILKSRCVIINKGEPNEENIINFTYHICHHDEGTNHPSCEPSQEI